MGRQGAWGDISICWRLARDEQVGGLFLYSLHSWPKKTEVCS